MKCAFEGNNNRKQKRRQLFAFHMPAYPTFAPKDYHRTRALSLLCSEWEKVEHARVKHRQIKSKKSAPFIFKLINIKILLLGSGKK